MTVLDWSSLAAPRALVLAGQTTRVVPIGACDVGWLARLCRGDTAAMPRVLDALLHRLVRDSAGSSLPRRTVDALALADKQQLLAAIVARNAVIIGVPVCAGGGAPLASAIGSAASAAVLERLATTFVEAYVAADGLVRDAAIAGVAASGA